jgi:hypothetical protein
MVTLAADLFFVDGIAFLINVSRQIKFITAEHVPTRTAKSLLSKHMQQVIQMYARAGFNVRTALMNKEFKKVKNKLQLLVCNTMAAKEHMRKDKWNILTIKECTRWIIGTLLFENIPQKVKMEFIYFVAFWLNAFPVKSRVSGVY